MNREELENLRSKYEEIMNILNKILMIHQFQRKRMNENTKLIDKKKNMDLFEMNEWLIDIVNFYRQNNVEISERDFRNMFSINSLSYYRINEVISRYMKVFFENINDLENQKFSDLVLHGMQDLGILADVNPVIDEIIMGINKFNADHKSYFNQIIRDSVSPVMGEINIKMVGLDNLDEIVEKMTIRISELDEQIKTLDETSKNSELTTTKEQGFDGTLDSFCMMITQDRYKTMDNNQKKKLISRMPKIIEMIIKLRIFGHVKNDYLEYSKMAGYDLVLKNVEKEEKTLPVLNRRMLELVKQKKELESSIESKNGALDFGFKKRMKKRDVKVKETDERILNFGHSIVKCNERINQLKKGYLNGFYSRYGDISKLEDEYGIKEINDPDKLFGVFDFKKLPPSSESINEQFIDVGVVIPDMDSLEFKKISELSLSIMNSLNGFDINIGIEENSLENKISSDLEYVSHHKR